MWVSNVRVSAFWGHSQEAFDPGNGQGLTLKVFENTCWGRPYETE